MFLNRSGFNFPSLGGLITIGFSFVWAGCANGPELNKYPRSQIDRPFTLPKGVAAWDIPSVMSISRDNAGNTSVALPVPYPFYWQSSLADDWQLSWAPIPMMISHQFSYDDSGYLGANMGFGFGYSSVAGWYLAPSIGAKYRRKFTSTFALDTSVNFNPIIESNTPYTWSSDFQILAFFQLSPLVSLSVGPDLTFSNVTSYYNTFDYASGFTGTQTTFQTTLPLTAALSWSFDRQWDLDLAYRMNVIGHTDGSYSHVAVVQFVHFW